MTWPVRRHEVSPFSWQTEFKIESSVFQEFPKWMGMMVISCCWSQLPAGCSLFSRCLMGRIGPGKDEPLVHLPGAANHLQVERMSFNLLPRHPSLGERSRQGKERVCAGRRSLGSIGSLKPILNTRNVAFAISVTTLGQERINTDLSFNICKVTFQELYHSLFLPC